MQHLSVSSSCLAVQASALEVKHDKDLCGWEGMIEGVRGPAIQNNAGACG